MSYKSIAAMAEDAALGKRIMACAAQENKPDFANWVRQRIWLIVSHSQEWSDAWDYAVGNNVANPGNDNGVINDDMILSVVQPMQ